MTNKQKIETLQKQIRDLEAEIEKLQYEESEPRYPVSYTHLTLPTTPYV